MELKEFMRKNTFSVADRQAAFEEFSEEQAKTLIGKGHDYTAGRAEEDSYANFRIIADLLKGAPITPYTVAMIYMLKHTFSLITFAKTGKQESGEGLRGRHIDQANYTFILDQLTQDHTDFLEHYEAEREENGSEANKKPEEILET
jgi:hypothetical protein